MARETHPIGLAVVVLAGGEGRRIGGGKPDLLLGGETLLAHACAQAKAMSAVAAVAVRTLAPTTPNGFEVIADDPSIEGPLGGVASALEFARSKGCEAVLTLPCDTPFLPEDLARRLLRALAGRRAAAAASAGRVHPLCAVWKVGVEADLRAYAASGRRSALGLLEALDAGKEDWPVVAHDPFFNVNTMADLRQARVIAESLAK